MWDVHLQRYKTIIWDLQKFLRSLVCFISCPKSCDTSRYVLISMAPSRNQSTIEVKERERESQSWRPLKNETMLTHKKFYWTQQNIWMKLRLKKISRRCSTTRKQYKSTTTTMNDVTALASRQGSSVMSKMRFEACTASYVPNDIFCGTVGVGIAIRQQRIGKLMDRQAGREEILDW